MDTSPIAGFVAACALIAACESQPAVIFVANGGEFNVLSLTDEQDVCDAPARLGYLTWWDGATLRGCWVRDGGHIRMRITDLDDLRIPVGDFRRTEIAEYRNRTLD
ncbi:hypothetical protein [Variovorax sp. YR216]|uniref:hypothetical protein n=1 Tax=Variovorax sp. YR216 TaxID=1882828 RepID=UPI0008981B75|nr:hypothetical protein [Variovorax sp. YR216]SEB17721.1 hypothetical protein SAMN05444680_111144 [Variovorax sp. YR216]